MRKTIITKNNMHNKHLNLYKCLLSVNIAIFMQDSNFRIPFLLRKLVSRLLSLGSYHGCTFP